MNIVKVKNQIIGILFLVVVIEFGIINFLYLQILSFKMQVDTYEKSVPKLTSIVNSLKKCDNNNTNTLSELTRVHKDLSNEKQAEKSEDLDIEMVPVVNNKK